MLSRSRWIGVSIDFVHHLGGGGGDESHTQHNLSHGVDARLAGMPGTARYYMGANKKKDMGKKKEICWGTKGRILGHVVEPVEGIEDPSRPATSRRLAKVSAPIGPHERLTCRARRWDCSSVAFVASSAVAARTHLIGMSSASRTQVVCGGQVSSEGRIIDACVAVTGGGRCAQQRATNTHTRTPTQRWDDTRAAGGAPLIVARHSVSGQNT